MRFRDLSECLLQLLKLLLVLLAILFGFLRSLIGLLLRGSCRLEGRLRLRCRIFLGLFRFIALLRSRFGAGRSLRSLLSELL